MKSFPAVLAATAAVSLIGTAAFAQVTYGAGAGGSIPDNNVTGFSSGITVDAGDQIIGALNSVTISGLVHTYMQDLAATLSHGGTTINLFNGPGDSTDFNGTYTFVPGGANLSATAAGLGATQAIPSGTYAPANSYTPFVGLDLSGLWTLNISDRAAADTGSFANWSFNATGIAPPPPDPYTGGAGGNIPDNGSLATDITVTNSGLISQFNSVTLRGLNHSLLGDLSASLLHVSTGTSVDLFSRVGRDTNDPFNFGDDSNFNGTYTFNLDGASLLRQAQQGNDSYNVPGGVYAASTNAVGALADPDTLNAFSNENINGVWRLLVSDSSLGDIGSFAGWSFNADVALIPEPRTLPLLSLGLGAFALACRRRLIRS